ncbi:ImpE protein [Novipirellula aureliae]|uniref:ImpE protein n=1 Tax=Novipirellula aureliae TaxID=2527966 RepID=A0A5C6E8T2_9BACT|nr:type VI secretion system accessory protein TagJ [Novipirellula aureliae]TWU45190.1 ImpE protein [Novipirellula aureliae]
MSETPQTLFQAGKLDEALAQSLALVKKNPANSGLRFQLAEISCIAGDLERAERQMETVSNQDPNAALGAALFRQLVRAEMARRECFFEGRVPEFIGEPNPVIKRHLLALAAIREGDLGEAAALIQDQTDVDTTVARAATTWDVNGEAVGELRDLDDLLAPILEVHTSTGKYFWIAWDQILSMEVHPPKRSADLLWRQASLSIESGPDGEVYLPAIYLDPSQPVAEDESLRLGRSTDWVETHESIVRGRGQKMLLAGNQDLTFMQLESIERQES